MYDIRNSKIFDLAEILNSSKLQVDIYDPWIKNNRLKKNKSFKFINIIKKKYDVLILGVDHDIFKNLNLNKIKKITKNRRVIFDINNSFKEDVNAERL